MRLVLAKSRFFERSRKTKLRVFAAFKPPYSSGRHAQLAQLNKQGSVCLGVAPLPRPQIRNRNPLQRSGRSWRCGYSAERGHLGGCAYHLAGRGYCAERSSLSECAYHLAGRGYSAQRGRLSGCACHLAGCLSCGRCSAERGVCSSFGRAWIQF